MKKIILIIVLMTSLSAKVITPNDVYAQVELISKEMDGLFHYYKLKREESRYPEPIHTLVKPRDVWQKTYEVMIKINMFRLGNDLPLITPVNMEPVLYLNPDLVYEQTQRILTEIKIFEYRKGIPIGEYKAKIYYNKTPLDVFNRLNKVSVDFDVLNRTGFTPSYVFGQTLRIYDDLTMILQYLKIKDNTIPNKRNDSATPRDTFNVAMQILQTIKKIQISVGIESVDWEAFRQKNPNPSSVFMMTQMILAELQTIKAYIGLKHYITPPASMQRDKTPADVDQMMQWILRKVEKIDLNRRAI